MLRKTIHYSSYAGMYQRNVATSNVYGNTFEEFKQNLVEFCLEHGFRYVQPEIRTYFGDISWRGESVPVTKVTEEDISRYEDLGASKNQL